MNKHPLVIDFILGLLSFLQTPSPSPAVEQSKTFIDVLDPYLKFLGGVVALLVAIIGVPAALIELRKKLREGRATTPPEQRAAEQTAGSVSTVSSSRSEPGKLVLVALRGVVGLVLGLLYATWGGLKFGASIVRYMAAFSALAALGMTVGRLITDGFNWRLLLGGFVGLFFAVGLLLVLLYLYLCYCFVASCYAAHYAVYGNPAGGKQQWGNAEAADLGVALLGGIFGALFGVIYLLLVQVVFFSAETPAAHPYVPLLVGGLPGFFLGVVSGHTAENVLSALDELLHGD